MKDPELSAILGDEAVERMSKWDSVIGQKMDQPFSLMVIGDFKRGKSTIINAILGRSIAPVNVAPETFTINCIHTVSALRWRLCSKTASVLPLPRTT